MKNDRNILVSGFFSGAINSSKIEYFDRVQEALGKYGIKLILINLSGQEFKSKCEGYSLFAIEPNESSLKISDLNGKLRYALDCAVSVLTQMRDQSPENARKYILSQSYKLASFCLQNDIQRCLLWAQFQPLNTFALPLLESMGIRCGFVHLGLLPGTISLMAQGEMAESWLCTDSPTFACLPVAKSDLKDTEEYLYKVRTRELNRKEQPQKGKLRSRLHRVQERDSLIFYAGINDFCSGILPRWSERATFHSPFYNDTYDGLQALASVAEQLNAKLVYKPHPNLKYKESDEVLCEKMSIVYANDANIFECLDATHVTTTILSQTAYLALIREKPVVLMGRMPLSGKGCTFELESSAHLEELLARAIKSGFTEEQRMAWYRHVAQLLKYALFSFNPEFDKMFNRGPDQAALWLNRF
jgi:hypothetical protein